MSAKVFYLCIERAKREEKEAERKTEETERKQKGVKRLFAFKNRDPFLKNKFAVLSDFADLVTFQATKNLNLLQKMACYRQINSER